MYIVVLFGFLAFFGIAIILGYVIYNNYYAPKPEEKPIPTVTSQKQGEVQGNLTKQFDDLYKKTLTKEDQIKELQRLIDIYQNEELPYLRQRIKQARTDLNFARNQVSQARFHQDGPPMPGSQLQVADSLLSTKLNMVNNLMATEDTRKQELEILKMRLQAINP